LGLAITDWMTGAVVSAIVKAIVWVVYFRPHLNGHRDGIVSFSEDGSSRRRLLLDQLAGRRAVVTGYYIAQDIGTMPGNCRQRRQ